MKAVVWNGAEVTVDYSRPLPNLRDDYLLIKTVTVALNPTDSKAVSQKRALKNGLLGCDFAGVVEEIGPRVTKPWKRGDRVFGATFGGNPSNSEDGAFAEFIVAKGDTCMRIPDKISFEEAASFGVSAITDGQGLFEEMKLNLPTDPIQKKEYLLVYGGSSSTGTLAIQYGKLAGYSVITTCSPRSYELVISRGAEAVFDYSDPTCGQQIYDYTRGKLKLVFDTIGSDRGIEICSTALSKEAGCRYGTILLNDFPRKDAIRTDSILMTFLGEPIDLFGKHFPANAAHFEFAKRFTELTEWLLKEGKLKAHPVIVGEGGLRGILGGLKLIRDGKISGVKLVYRVAETGQNM
ncbi:alcohol dehydrogenase, putative [Paecilomyces variotii No. 5]|uniref:Alcohol dehydrogenase, putative n=1 Tax=Byssochlamys spectabilis (strain No. 5 / NBRC 109023) TaxID=1356009 RepID=V5FTJ3_BYSSN|nr:alcohol dehydrogenase, putative [Paecilomyces variotii No. 5]